MINNDLKAIHDTISAENKYTTKIPIREIFQKYSFAIEAKKLNEQQKTGVNKDTQDYSLSMDSIVINDEFEKIYDIVFEVSFNNCDLEEANAIFNKYFKENYGEFNVKLDIKTIKKRLNYTRDIPVDEIFGTYSFAMAAIITNDLPQEISLKQNFKKYKDIINDNFEKEDFDNLLKDIKKRFSNFDTGLYEADKIDKDALISHKNIVLNLYKKMIKQESVKIKQKQIDIIKESCYKFSKAAWRDLSWNAFSAVSNYNGPSSESPGNEKTLISENESTIDFYKKYLQEKKLKNLCKLLGKNFKNSSGEIMANYASNGNLDDFLKEQISGVTLGKDLENALPNELALIGDPDFGILFDLKFAENRLFCFKKQGFVRQDNFSFECEQNNKKGPIVLCVDTSLSMSGEPEAVAKAIVLFISKLATNENRPLFLINFGINIVTLDITLPRNLSVLMNFLNKIFYGGTDINPAIKKACKLIRTIPKFKNADVLVISDMIFDRIKHVKPKGSKFYALALEVNGCKSNIDPFFDKFYTYPIHVKSMRYSGTSSCETNRFF